MRAEDITAPAGSVTLGGKPYPTRYDHEQIRQTEMAWQALTMRPMGYMAILMQAQRGVYTALCALCYGAIASGQKRAGVAVDKRLTLLQFDRIAEYRQLLGAQAPLLEDALRAMDDGQKKKTQPEQVG